LIGYHSIYGPAILPFAARKRPALCTVARFSFFVIAGEPEKMSGLGSLPERQLSAR
jgi:hypothetical protein